MRWCISTSSAGRWARIVSNSSGKTFETAVTDSGEESSAVTESGEEGSS